jgi:hypothetical protein
VAGHSWWWVGRGRALSLVQPKELLKVGLELPSQGAEVLALPARDGGNDLGWLSTKFMVQKMLHFTGRSFDALTRLDQVISFASLSCKTMVIWFAMGLNIRWRSMVILQPGRDGAAGKNRLPPICT